MTITQVKLHTAWVIDDDEIDQYLYRRIFKRSDRIENISHYLYADDALAHLKSVDCEPIDVIFLDINMPRMNGFQFLDAIAEQFGHSFDSAVVVMLTTSIEKEDVERCKQHGYVKAYLNKPLTEEAIDYIIDDIVLNGSREE